LIGIALLTPIRIVQRAGLYSRPMSAERNKKPNGGFSVPGRGRAEPVTLFPPGDKPPHGVLPSYAPVPAPFDGRRVPASFSTRIFSHPACASVAAWSQRLASGPWPSVAALDSLYADRLRPLRLVEDRRPRRTRGPRPVEDVYEVRVGARGELPTRASSWHDLMNVLVWCAFPRSKRALSDRQYQLAITRHTMPGRNREQDALALFDEGGIVVLCRPGLALPENDAAALRVEVARGEVRLWLFGHALLEAVARGDLAAEDRRGTGLRLIASPQAPDADEIDAQLADALTDPTRFVRPVRERTLWLGAALGTG
jgi:hypothetical protein